jgi:hypothetical protein
MGKRKQDNARHKLSAREQETASLIDAKIKEKVAAGTRADLYAFRLDCSRTPLFVTLFAC